MAPTVAHFVWLPAPRGGRCACGPAKPVPRPLLARAGMGRLVPRLRTRALLLVNPNYSFSLWQKAGMRASPNPLAGR